MQPQPDPNAPPGPRPALDPKVAAVYQQVKSGAHKAVGDSGGDDNSNTQFAIVALWIGQKRGVPCKAAFKAIESRFIRSQNLQDSGWGYTFGGPGLNGGGSGA